MKSLRPRAFYNFVCQHNLLNQCNLFTQMKINVYYKQLFAVIHIDHVDRKPTNIDDCRVSANRNEGFFFFRASPCRVSCRQVSVGSRSLDDTCNREPYLLLFLSCFCHPIKVSFFVFTKLWFEKFK